MTAILAMGSGNGKRLSHTMRWVLGSVLLAMHDPAHGPEDGVDDRPDPVYRLRLLD